MDDLSRVKRAADAATDFSEFRNTLRSEQNAKFNEERYKPHRQSLAGDAPPGPRLVSRPDSAVFHVSTCAQSTTAKVAGEVKEPFPPCTCGASRRFRLHNAEHIEAHLDSGGTMTHRNALELRSHWAQAEAELTDALEQIEKLSARINSDGAVMDDLERER